MFFDETRWGAIADILPGAGFRSGAAGTHKVAEADIQQLSIEQLGNVEIASVSKTPHALPAATAAHATDPGDVTCANTNVPGELPMLADFEARLRF